MPPTVFVASAANAGVYEWDDGQWQAVGGGLHRSGYWLCNALRVVDEDGPGPMRPVLLAGGNFSGAGSVQANNVARWDGTAWSAMGSGVGPSGHSQMEIHDFAAVDSTGGTGAPTIYAVGTGAFDSGVFRWNPGVLNWTLVGPMPFVMAGTQMTLTSFGGGEPRPSLYVTGWIGTIGGVAAQNFARLRCEACYADCDGSQGLTANDFACFITRYVTQDAYAECDGVGGFTANDFACFLSAFAAGCS